MQPHKVEGYEHIVAAVELLSTVVSDLFAAPGAAQARAIAERERLGDDHGDDLLCGCWSAPETATALLELGGRHIDAVLHLALEHPGFMPSAQVLSRAALETLLRMCWLLAPADARDREQRWVALKREEDRFFSNVAKKIPTVHGPGDDHDLMSKVIGGQAVSGVPRAEALAKEFGRTDLLYDFFYRWASQPTHGTLVGAGTFEMKARQEWMRQGGMGEWVEAEFWALPLNACWEGVAVALPVYCGLLVPDHVFPGLDHQAEFIRELRAVPANFQARAATGAAAATAVAPQPVPPSPNRAQRRAQASSARRRRS